MRSLRPLVAAVGLLGATVSLVQVPASAAAPPAVQSLSDERAEAERLRATLTDLRTRSGQSILLLEQAETALGTAVTRSVALSRELDDARADARGSERRLDRRVAALYRSGGAVGLWTTLLDARTPYELASRKANLDAVVASDARLRSRAEQGSDRLAGLEQQARDGAAERVRAAQVAEEQTAALAASMAEQQALLSGATERVRQLVEEQRRAAAFASQLAQAAQAGPSGPLTTGGAPSTGTLTVPVGLAYAGPAGACPVAPVHSFTDTWGAPRSGGRKHQGTDVFAPYGSPAYAVVDGVIDKVGNGGLGGITLWLRGDDGDRYYYAHNAANIAQLGQRVRAGEQIAYVGTTGNASTTPPHIHFEAHFRGGRASNPYPWLAALCAG